MLPRVRHHVGDQALVGAGQRLQARGPRRRHPPGRSDRATRLARRTRTSGFELAPLASGSGGGRGSHERRPRGRCGPLRRPFSWVYGRRHLHLTLLPPGIALPPALQLPMFPCLNLAIYTQRFINFFFFVKFQTKPDLNHLCSLTLAITVIAYVPCFSKIQNRGTKNVFAEPLPAVPLHQVCSAIQSALLYATTRT